MDTIKLLEKLTSPVGVAGEEQSSFEGLKELFSRYGNVSTDAMGNIIIERDGNAPHILLDAHLDTIGFVVTGITDDGFARLAKVGGIDMRTVEGMELIIHGEKDVYGVVCTVPPHLSDGDSKVSKDGTCILDIGMSRENAEKVISIGDKVSFKPSFDIMGENRVTATYIDDRGGIAVLLKALEYVNTDKKITVLCSAQEETGGTGATCGAFNIDADVALAVDVSFAESPDCNPRECGKMNGGAMIGFSPALSREYSDLLVSLAKEYEIPYQKEIMGGRTGTNADHITVSKGGIPTALVSLPERNMHTPIEMVDIRDIESCAKLVARFIERV